MVKVLFERLVGAIAMTAAFLVLAATAAHAQQFKALYRFTGGTDGASPQSSLLLWNGKLYGTALYGGSAPMTCGAASFGNGTVFQIDLTSGQETTLHVFAGGPSDGASPNGGLIADSAGNLYGTTVGGGTS